MVTLTEAILNGKFLFFCAVLFIIAKHSILDVCGNFRWIQREVSFLIYHILSFKRPGRLYIFFDFGVGVYWRVAFIQKT